MDKDIIAQLDEELDPCRVKQKKVPDRPDADYLESYDVIDTANRIFGYGRWGTSVLSQEINQVGGKTVCEATIRLDVVDCLPQEDKGVVVAAQKKDQPLTPEALETAIKGAVSDGKKRCFRHFGNQFGNSLYSKEKPVAKPTPKARQAAKTDDPGQIKGVPALDERKAAPDAETLRMWIHRRVEAKNKEYNWDEEDRATVKQLGLMSGLLVAIFGKDEIAERKRHQFLEFMFGALTSKELTKGQASVLIDWAKDPLTKHPHPVAIAEAQMVIRTCENVAETEIPY